MNREIKFRAWSRTGDWDEEGETQQFEMISADNLAFYTSDLLKNQLRDIDDDFYVMQFTGLKDKYGKEIYEGDILRLKYDKINIVHTINWNNEYCCYDWEVMASSEKQAGRMAKAVSDAADKTGKNYCELIEIIGNIYENPELI